MRHVLRSCLSHLQSSRWMRVLSGSSPGRWRGYLRFDRFSSRGTSTRVWSVVAMVGLLTSLVSVAVWPATTTASSVDVLANGGFEQGFGSQAGCGMVGSGWQCFTNGGAANYGFYDDQWDRTVADGKHSQLIEINTKGIMVGDADRYAGIYQTVPVVDWRPVPAQPERHDTHDQHGWRSVALPRAGRLDLRAERKLAERDQLDGRGLGHLLRAHQPRAVSQRTART